VLRWVFCSFGTSCLEERWEVRLKTASWFADLPADHIRIGISRGPPRDFPAGYRAFRRLAPGSWFNSVSTSEYIRRYQSEVLAQLDPRAVFDHIVELADDRVPVLCCFERVGRGQWCHRALAATWLADEVGESIPELGFEHLSQHQHPLLPPRLRHGGAPARILPPVPWCSSR